MTEHVVIVELDVAEEATLDALSEMSGRTATSLLKSIIAEGIHRCAGDPMVVEHRRNAVRAHNRSEQARRRDEALLAFIADHQRAYGYPPSIREIGDAFGWSSPSTTHAHLLSLHRQGRLQWRSDRPRTLRVVGENPVEQGPD